MVMGVSGSGKSTIGTGLAIALGGVFLDGDDYHPQANIDHMTAGHPLTDAMRWPWLNALAEAVNAKRQDQITVFACSALKKSYRDHLRGTIAGLRIAYLDAPQDIVSARIATRQHDYMPTTLLDSQYATLEVPVAPSITVRVDQPVDRIINTLRGLI